MQLRMSLGHSWQHMHMHHVFKHKSKKKRNSCALFFQQSCRESENWNKLNPKKYNKPFFLWPQNLNPNNDYKSLNSHLNTKDILHPNPCGFPGRGSPNWPGYVLRNARDTRAHFCSMGWKSKRHHMCLCLVIKHTSDAREQTASTSTRGCVTSKHASHQHSGKAALMCLCWCILGICEGFCLRLCVSASGESQRACMSVRGGSEKHTLWINWIVLHGWWFHMTAIL